MEKKLYSRPGMVCEKFTPHNYCYVCYPVGSAGVYAPFKEANGLPGLQIQGTSQGWHGTTQNYPADGEERNWDGVLYLKCDPPVYKVYPKGESAMPSDGSPLEAWEAYYTHGGNTGQGVYVFHDISGNTYYKINTTVDFKEVESNHS